VSGKWGGSGRERGEWEGGVGVDRIMHPTKHTYLHVIILSRERLHKHGQCVVGLQDEVVGWVGAECVQNGIHNHLPEVT